MTGLVSPDIRPDHWIYVGWLLVVYGAISLALALIGRHDDLTNPVRIFFRRISNALREGTGYPGWSMAGALSGLAMLGTAAMGLYWDVAWHIDLGRDRELFTPSHVMILVGLGGLIFAAAITAIFATNDEADVGLRIGSARIPWSAVSLGALGIGGLAAFPFDALWHDAYGIDITLWSPSHLMLVGGGGLATISLWLMMAEARKHAEPTWIGKGIEGFIAGTILVGVSAFQGEFDFGVPQFQVLYWPLLVVIAAGLTLVTARIALGRGGALAAVVGFLVVRGIIAVLVGVSLNHTVPRFPLYLASALAVEAVALWLGTDNRVRFAIAAGLGIATFGLAGELVWAGASGWFTPTGTSLFAKMVVLAPLAAIAAALLGAGLSRAFGGEGVPGWMLGAAGAVLIAVLAVPLPRNVGDVQAVIRLRPVDTALPAADPAADGGVRQAIVEVDLQPADAAKGALAFGVTSWQGGGRLSAALDETAPGRYVASRPLPIGGDWKTTVGLFRGDQVMAAGVYLPADESIGASEIPALAERRTRFVRNTTLLLREVTDGPAWPALVAYAGLAATAAVWVALFGLAVKKVAPDSGSLPGPAGGHPWRLPRHLGIDGRPGRVLQAGSPVPLVDLQQRIQ